MTSTFDEAIATVEHWADSFSKSLPSAQDEAIAEIRRRLGRLQTTFTRLAEINSRLMAIEPLTTSFDPDTDTFSAGVGDHQIQVKLKRKEPGVPIRFTKLTEGVAYSARPQDEDSNLQASALRTEMEDLLENYYYNAHRILKLIQGLPRMKNFKCKEIAIVRNKLIEHADHGDLYSFGYGSTGPRVKPMGRPGRDWHDDGLFTNTERFLSALISHISGHIARDA